MSMNNDIAFLITGNLNLYEHQSTVCPNLPLRFLLYTAAEYEGLVARMRANIYGRTLIPLPQPHCVVFYNGDDEMEDEQYLYLSDAYTEKQNPRDAPCLDLKVRVLNINHGHNHQLMSKCTRLAEYVRFVDSIKGYRQDGFSTDQSIDNAVMFCIDHGILEDILLPRRAEVKKMLLTEYNERKYMRMFRKEAQEEGRKEGREEGREEGRKQGRMEERTRLLNTMLQNGLTAEELSRLTGLSPDENNNAQNPKNISSTKGKLGIIYGKKRSNRSVEKHH